jgi:hypothetical protein
VTPQRLVLQRSKGFNLQALSQAVNGMPALRVTRPGKWGNPFVIAELAQRFGLDQQAAHDMAIELHRQWLARTLDPALWPGYPPPERSSIVRELAGKNLACWCRADETCHADTLIKLANSEDLLEN